MVINAIPWICIYSKFPFKKFAVPKKPPKTPIVSNHKTEDLQKNMERDLDEMMTTVQGLKINDDQNSLRDGERGGTLLYDFILREKITHYEHERDPATDDRSVKPDRQILGTENCRRIGANRSFKITTTH